MTRDNTPVTWHLPGYLRRLRPVGSSASYWERRYRTGGTSGDGSYGENAGAKATIVNRVVTENDIASMIEFGCGDGNQLGLLKVPHYIGLDVSATAIRRCSDRFPTDDTKSFLRYDPEHFVDRARVLTADLALSQEVIFHLIEDVTYERYMTHLFDAAERLVLIYSTDVDEPQDKHVRHRTFTPWVEQHKPEWVLTDRIASPRSYDPATREGMLADFFLYRRADLPPPSGNGIVSEGRR
jgi:hypothetical protein